jgi:uncharacterized protein YjbI with pentapeptide repeats
VREEALQRYLDRMSELVLDKKLRESKQYDAVRATARARTLTVLRSLDGHRKGQVVRFLYEADLIGKVVIDESGERQVIEATIDLHTADLIDAYLSGAILTNANINAILANADLSDAYLFGTILHGAILVNAGLSGAYPHGAYLGGADLSGAEGWTNEQLAQAYTLVGATLPDGTVMTDDA